jgi:hypothetical protein
MVGMGKKYIYILFWHLKPNVLSLKPKFLSTNPSGINKKNAIILKARIELSVK